MSAKPVVLELRSRNSPALVRYTPKLSIAADRPTGVVVAVGVAHGLGVVVTQSGLSGHGVLLAVAVGVAHGLGVVVNQSGLSGQGVLLGVAVGVAHGLGVLVNQSGLSGQGVLDAVAVALGFGVLVGVGLQLPLQPGRRRAMKSLT